MLGMMPTHVQCNECGTRTEIEPGGGSATTPCFWCQENLQDPTNVAPVAVLPCPNGVTSADWAQGNRSCPDQDHESKTGMHIIEVD